MKFLCVPCDSPMKIRTVAPPDRGSLSVVYSCPECGYEMAMLTNPYETQLVQSLGVRVGPGEAAGAGSPPGAASRGGAPSMPAQPSDGAGDSRTAAEEGPRCPFAAMVPAMEPAEPPTVAGVDRRGESSAGAGPADASPTGAVSGRGADPGPDAAPGAARDLTAAAGVSSPALRWTPEAEARLGNIPAFVRPMARTGIEKFARERGWSEVDAGVLDAAREFFGM